MNRIQNIKRFLEDHKSLEPNPCYKIYQFIASDASR